MRGIMLTCGRYENAVKSKNVVAKKAQQNAQVERIPHTQNVEAEALFGESYKFIEHIASTPEPEDNFKRGDFDGTIDQDGQKQTQHDGEGHGREQLPIARNTQSRKLEERSIFGIIKRDGASNRGLRLFRRDGLRDGIVGDCAITAASGRRGGGRFAVQVVSSRMEDDGASPDCFELLYNEWVGEEALSLSSDGDLDRRDARSTVVLSQLGTTFGGAQSLERVEVVAQSINQFANREVFEQAHGQQLGHHRPRGTDTSIPGVLCGFFLELQAIGNQGAYRGAIEVFFADLGLDGFDQELRHLGRAQLVPREAGLAFLYDEDAARVGDVV